jgi:hypothetical protein
MWRVHRGWTKHGARNIVHQIRLCVRVPVMFYVSRSSKCYLFIQIAVQLTYSARFNSRSRGRNLLRLGPPFSSPMTGSPSIRGKLKQSNSQGLVRHRLRIQMHIVTEGSIVYALIRSLPISSPLPACYISTVVKP